MSSVEKSSNHNENGPRNRTPKKKRIPRKQPSASTENNDELAKLQSQLQEKDEQLATLMNMLKQAGVIPYEEEEEEEEVKQDETSDEEKSEAMVRAPIFKETKSRGSTFKTFTNCRPPHFKGGDDPLGCMRWIRKLEQVFRSDEFTEEQMVNYSVRTLEDDALEWWDTIDKVLSNEGRQALTWDRFKEKVMERYCSPGAMETAAQEFLELKKGDMPISKYNTMFTEKLQFARDLCPTDAKLVERYARGLPFEYKATVRLQINLGAAMDAARRMEGDIIERDREEKKKSGEKRKSDNSERRLEDRKEKKDYCKACNSTHAGPCTKETRRCRRCGKLGHKYEDCKSVDPICYNCKEFGHISINCPKKKNDASGSGRREEGPKSKARVFNMITDL